SFGFEYACAAGEPGAGDWKSLEVGAGAKQSVSGVEAGLTCWLREKPADVEGGVHALTWTLNGAAVQGENVFDGGVKFTVAADASVAVVATNEYSVAVGKVLVAKKVD